MDNKNAITSCSLILTEQCNLRCTYCFEREMDYKKNDMSAETANEAVDFLVSEALKSNSKSISITYFGGEPMMNMKTMNSSFDYAIEQTRKNNLFFDCLIITNGTIFNDEVKDFILKWHKATGQVNVQISTDGLPEINDISRIDIAGNGSSGAIKKTIVDLLSFCKEHSIATGGISVHSVLTKTALPKMYDSYRYFKELGIPRVWNMPLHEEAWDDSDREIYREQLELVSGDIYDECMKTQSSTPIDSYSSLAKCKTSFSDKPCGAGCTYATVTVDGELYPCHHFYFNDDQISIGNIRDGVDDRKRALFLEYDFSNLIGVKPCSECDNYSCYHCIAANYTNNGNMLIAFPEYCEMQFVEQKIRDDLMEKLANAGLVKPVRATYNGDNGDIQVLANSMDATLSEILLDREFLKESVKAIDNNMDVFNDRINSIDEKINDILDLISVMSMVLIEAQKGE